MEFRYPKARLFAYNRLAAGDSCYAVMIQAVTDAGLLSDESAASLNHAAEHGAQCGALHAAEKIMSTFMRERHDPQKAQELSSAAVKQIESDLECWKKTVNIQDDCKDDERSSSSCRDMTPVVLDFLLQQIMRH